MCHYQFGILFLQFVVSLYRVRFVWFNVLSIYREIAGCDSALFPFLWRHLINALYAVQFSIFLLFHLKNIVCAMQPGNVFYSVSFRYSNSRFIRTSNSCPSQHIWNINIKTILYFVHYTYIFHLGFFFFICLIVVNVCAQTS